MTDLVRGLLHDSLSTVYCLRPLFARASSRFRMTEFQSIPIPPPVDLTGFLKAIRWTYPNYAINRGCKLPGSGTISAKDNPVRPIGVHLEASLKPLSNASPEVLR